MVDITTRKDLLKAQACFGGLNDEELSALASLLTEKTFSPNEYIVIEGSKVDSIYIIVSGDVEVRHMLLKDNKLVVDNVTRLGPADAIGLNDRGFFSSSGKRTATVVAIKEVLSLYLSFASFHRFLTTHPHANEWMAVYVRRHFP